MRRPLAWLGASIATGAGARRSAPGVRPRRLAPRQLVRHLRRLRHEDGADLAVAVVHDDLRRVAGVAPSPGLGLLVLVELGARLLGALLDDRPAAEARHDVD